MKLIVLLFLFISTLYADSAVGAASLGAAQIGASSGADVAEIKQAVMQNPALLNTPQAQAVMQEHGVTATQVEQKLGISNSSTTTNDSNQTNTNNQTNSTATTNSSTTTTATDTSVGQNVPNVPVITNPFMLQSSDQLKQNLADKKQTLDATKLSRYSMRFFMNNNQIDSASLPTPKDYIITNGDEFTIVVYGDRDASYQLDVKNDGSLTIPFIGPVQVGGMSFAEARKHLERVLLDHYKTSSFNITINKYSTIQVTLIGEVKAPGLYNLPSLSSVKDLLIVANGIKENGSVRDIEIKRDSRVIAHLDLYNLLFNKNEFNTVLLKHGDTVIVNRAKKLASIDGYVNDAGVFELSAGENLDKLIEYGGGMKPSASKANIKIKRYSDNAVIKTIDVNYKEAHNFKMQNGDSVYIYPLDFSAQNSINIYGNVIRSGNYDLTDDKTLSGLLQENIKLGIKKFFLPNTYFQYGVIKRYDKDLHYTTISFNLQNVLDNKEAIKLEPQDELFIFNKNDIYANAYITTIGDNLTNPGKLQYYEGMTLQDAVNASGIKGLLDDKVRITTFHTKDHMPLTHMISLKNDAKTILYPYDEIQTYGFYDTHILKPVSVQGEVVNPTSTYYTDNMSVAKLISIAGGFTNEAFKNKLEIVRYYLDENQTRQRTIIDLDIKDKNLNEVLLQPYDEVTIFKIPRWGERKTVTLSGQIKFPGTYTIADGERLVDVLQRAGGFTDKAFVNGAVFTRESVRLNQMDEYTRSLAQIKKELTIFAAMPANSSSSSTASMGMGQSNISALDGVLADAAKYQPIGRINIQLDKDLSTLAQSDFNIALNDKDTLTVPSTNDTVTVFGEIFNPNAFVFDRTKSVSDYITMAGGYLKSADAENVYIIHANGNSEKLHNGWLSSNVKLAKGDTVVIPLYIKEYSSLAIWTSVSQILSQFAITAAAFNTLGIVK